ncbi:MAG TPA: hypothetical protein VN083_03980, partial [Vicinamibacteria bacterium]|nr:hypothetical protein [Vicinamibacteria bacterium]
MAEAVGSSDATNRERGACRGWPLKRRQLVWSVCTMCCLHPVNRSLGLAHAEPGDPGRYRYRSRRMAVWCAT